MCKVTESLGGGAWAILIGTVALIGVMAGVIVGVNALTMLWTSGTVNGVWADSVGDIGYAMMLTLPVLPVCGWGASRRRRRCCV